MHLTCNVIRAGFISFRMLCVLNITTHKKTLLTTLNYNKKITEKHSLILNYKKVMTT